MFVADALCADYRDRRQKPELTSRLLKTPIQRRKFHSLFLKFRSTGLFFPLTSEGHIEVSIDLPNILCIYDDIQES